MAGARDELVDLVRRVADASLHYPSYRYKTWGWGEWIVIEGLLASHELTGEARYLGFVEGLVAGWLDPDRPLVPTDHFAPGSVLLRLNELNAQPNYPTMARRLADVVVAGRRADDADPFVRPDGVGHIWVDSLYPDPSLLIRVGRNEGNEDFWNTQAAAFVSGTFDRLIDPGIPLPFHGHDLRTDQRMGLRWGRGAAWAILGMVDGAALLPVGSGWREPIATRVAALAGSLAATQASSGHWHTVLDEPGTYEEPSIAAFMTTALSKAMRCGLLDAGYAGAAERAWDAMIAALAPDGTYQVSVATPAGDVGAYQQLPLGIFPWGQGPVLRALEERAIALGLRA